MNRVQPWTEWLTASSPRGWALRLAVLAALQGVLAYFSSHTGLPPFQSPLIWLNTGLLTGILWQSAPRVWPLWIAASLLGETAVLASSWSAMPTWLSASISLLETGQSMFAAGLLRRLIPRRDVSLNFIETLSMVAICGGATLLFGVLGGALLVQHYSTVDWLDAWMIWTLTDLTGCVMVLPILVNWELPKHTGTVMPRRTMEALAFVVITIVIAAFVFDESDAALDDPLRRRYWLIPVFVWGGLRLTPRCVMVGFLACAAVIALRSVPAMKAMNWSFLEVIDQHIALQVLLLVGAFSTLSLACAMWERRTLQAALQSQLELLNWTLDAAQAGPWEYRANGRDIVLSDVWKRQLGYTPAELPDAFFTWSSRLHPDDRERCVNYARQFVAEGNMAPYEIQFRIRHRNGNYRSVLSRAKLQRDAQGNVVRLSGIHIDITPLKEAEEALRYQAQFEELIAALSARFIRCDLARIDQEITHSLEAIGRFTKVDRCFFYKFADDLRTVSCRNEWCDERLPLSIASFQNMPTTGFEWSLSHFTHGQTVYLPRVSALPTEAVAERRLVRLNHVRSIVLEPVLSARRLVGLVGFVSVREPRQWPQSHLTLLKLVAEMLANAVARQQNEAALADARAKLTHAARLSLLGEMVAGISHELKQPLHAIRGFAAAGLRSTQPQSIPNVDELRQWLMRIVSLVDRSSTIIQRFRDFSRRAPEEYGPQDLQCLVAEAQEIVRAELRKYGVEVRLQGAPDLQVHGDAVQLVQVFVNLLHNACEAARDLPNERRRVDIDAHRSNGVVDVCVRDYGRGLGDGLVEHIFEPFVTTRPNGTGIGLAICRTIVREHGGGITAEQAEPGLMFRLTLPAHAEVDGQ